MSYTFAHNEPTVAIDGADGEDVTVELSRDGQWRAVVKLTCRASATFAKAAAYLDPDGARALASVLETFAVVADLNRYDEAGGDEDDELTPASILAPKAIQGQFVIVGADGRLIKFGSAEYFSRLDRPHGRK